MLKALLATAAITVCCIGNEYPARSMPTGCQSGVLNCVMNGARQQLKDAELQRQIESEVRWQLQHINQSVVRYQ